MPDGAQGVITLDAYPNREEAFIGAAYKTLTNCELGVERAIANQAAAIVAHKEYVAGCKVELAESKARYAEVCKEVSEEDVTRVVAEFEVRRAEAKEDAADLMAIRDRQLARRKRQAG